MSASPDRRGYRAKRLAVAGAGPLMNAALLALALNSDPSPGTLARDVAVVSGILLAGNLLPYATPTAFGPQSIDGRMMLPMLASPRREVDAQLPAYYLAEAGRPSARGQGEPARATVRRGLAEHPDVAALRTWLANDLLEAGRYAEARVAFLELVERERRPPASAAPHEHAIHVNNLAWADFMLGDPSLVPEAEEASRAAIAELPRLPAVKGTRAFALIESGRLREGLELGRAALRKERDARNRALQACVSAIALARDWRFPEAERWLSVAHRLDDGSALLGRASREIASRTPRPMAGR